MKKTISLVAIIATVGLIVSACTPESTTVTTIPAVTSTPTSTETVSETPAAYTMNVAISPTLGQYLVDGNGMTLYWTTIDPAGGSYVDGALLANWPSFYTENIEVPPSLNAGYISLFTRPDSSLQTTYKGYPLYHFIQDIEPGDTMGQGIMGEWSVVNPNAPKPKPVTATTSTEDVTSTAPGAATFQSVADLGEPVYANSCAFCHGSNGEGGIAPALWGAGATLGKYDTAQGLLNYTAATMPANAPGSLAHDQYLDVMAYILVQGSEVSESIPFVESQLSSITLK